MTYAELERAAALHRQLIDLRDQLQWFDRQDVRVRTFVVLNGQETETELRPQDVKALLIGRRNALIADLAALGVVHVEVEEPA